MAEQDIIQNLISRLGQSQDERLPPELDRHYVDIDERSDEDLLAQLAALAKHLRYYDAQGKEAGDWSPFFPSELNAELLARDDGQVPPHLALLLTFLKLYRHPQRVLNTLTGRHLDFQFRRVLGFVPRPARPDRAHVLLELKKSTTPLVVARGHSFSAGKDARGIELIYESVRDVVVNQARVAALQTVFREDGGLRFAPMANSGDGLGGPLDKAQPKWPPFGQAGLPAARIGLALASPVLRMQEGTRAVEVDLQLANLNPQRHTAPALASAWEAYLTGPKGWLGPLALSGNLVAGRLTLRTSIAATEPAVCDYQAAIHGHAFAAQAPVMQLLLQPSATLRYADLEGLTLSAARITVQVDGVTTLALENDFGSLNPKKAFLPFGPQPVAGSTFQLGCQEALSKRLLDLTVKLTWQGAPANLVDWYHDYDNQARMRNGVTATLMYQDRGGDRKSTVLDLMARDADGASILSSRAPSPTAQPSTRATEIYGLLTAGSQVGRWLGHRLMLAHPINQSITAVPPETRSGFLSVTLNDDFLHADYRREMVAKALNAKTPIVLNEPYTPTVRAVSLGYRAQSDEVDLSARDGVGGAASFTNPDLQFFHVGCFGQMREHAYLREQFAYVADKRVTLLPAYPHEGEFLIGLAGAAADDSVSLLLQAAEGSANPDLPSQRLDWWVLGDNYWRLLGADELALDTSNNLRTSGIVAVKLPRETTVEHTLMPANLVWLRATIAAHRGAVCQLVSVANNAVEVSFADQGNDPDHLSRTLEAGRISKLKSPLASIRTVTQPFASFGGQLRESDAMLTRRAAEQLRHRNRCLTPWDYERVVLEAFPEIHKVKCIPHASASSWLAPGHVTLVIVPDLRNQNAVDRLRPQATVDVLDRVGNHARRLSGMQVQIHVKNPRYQRVRLDFQVRFQPGLPFTFYRRQLHEELVKTLSPWAFDLSRSIEFAGQVYRSVLLDFVEKLPYVDFVTNFKLQSADSATPLQDCATVRAETPDAILVSHTSHVIAEA